MINPNAIVFVAFCTVLNYWINGQFVTGLLVGLGIVVLCGFIK